MMSEVVLVVFPHACSASQSYAFMLPPPLNDNRVASDAFIGLHPVSDTIIVIVVDINDIITVLSTPIFATLA